MFKRRLPFVGLLVLQVIAVIIYPFAFFRQAPQAAVLPPALFILMVVAIVATNTGGLSLSGGRNSLIFVQGINIVVRAMTLLSNLKSSEGQWNWALLLCQVIGITLSWYTMVEMEKRPLNTLLLNIKIDKA